MSKTITLDIKGNRKSVGHSPRNTKKRHYLLNRYSMEKEEASISTSAKKLKSGESVDFEVNTSFEYRLINFVSVFFLPSVK